MENKVRDENPMTLKRFSAEYPGVHVKTVRRWIKHGLKSTTNKEIHKLESEKIGGTRHTSVAAYNRWLDNLNKPKNGRMQLDQ